jgi:hypothetical protein
MSEKQKRFVFIGLGLIGLVVVFLLIVSFLPKRPTVVSTQPSSGSQNFSPNKSIIINFDQSVEPDKLTYQLRPQVQLAGTLSSNRKSLYLQPEKEFSLNTTYLLEILYEGKSLYKLSFQTIKTLVDQKADLTKVKNNLISKMPLDKSNYSIEYLDATDQFVITIKDSPVEKNKEEAAKWIKSQGLSNLESLNILWITEKWLAE